MDKKQLVREFWREVAAQNKETLPSYFSPDAIINWHNTDEQFSVDEYIIANCEYPGEWQGHVERIEVVSNDLVITVSRVFSANNSFSCHAVSFFRFETDKIVQLDEYWGHDGPPPQWRLAMELGRKISNS
jgi:hypothetical protein